MGGVGICGSASQIFRVLVSVTVLKGVVLLVLPLKQMNMLSLVFSYRWICCV